MSRREHEDVLSGAASVRDTLRGCADIDLPRYRRERYAQMLSGAPTWIARMTPGDSEEVYNYYVGRERVAYLAVGENGKPYGAGTMDNQQYVLPFAEDLSFDELVSMVEQVMRPNTH